MVERDTTTRPGWPMAVVLCVALLLLGVPADASRNLPDTIRPMLDGPVVGPSDLFRKAPVRRSLPFFATADLERFSASRTHEFDDPASQFCIYDGPDGHANENGGGGYDHAHLFQGLWTDPVTGIAYARNRWYDARTASWLSEDPMGAVDSPNLYAFVGWGPHSGRDPMGLAEVPCSADPTMSHCQKPEFPFLEKGPVQSPINIDPIPSVDAEPQIIVGGSDRFNAEPGPSDEELIRRRLAKVAERELVCPPPHGCITALPTEGDLFEAAQEQAALERGMTAGERDPIYWATNPLFNNVVMLFTPAIGAAPGAQMSARPGRVIERRPAPEINLLRPRATSNTQSDIPRLRSDVPSYAGRRTSGVLVTQYQDIPLQSGYAGPSSNLPRTGNPGMNWRIRSHVEAHAAAVMRQQGIREATLHINRAPCGGATGCDSMLTRMLPEGASLRLISPEGVKVYVGGPQ